MKSKAAVLYGCCLLTAVLLAACRRGDSASVSSDNSAGTNSSTNNFAATAIVSSTNFSVPFRGVIKAKERRDLTLNDAVITYTIGAGKIRREAVRTAPLGRVADLGQGAAGIICDAQSNNVVLYRSGLAGKYFVRMTLAEYRTLASEESIPLTGMTNAAAALLTTKPKVWKHAGTFFVDMPRPIPADQAMKAPNARTVGSLPCDVLMVPVRDTIFEVSHCQRVQVERQLLELVELRLPAEVTGFPLLMRRLQLVPVSPPNQNVSKAKQLVQKGVNWAAKVAERALKREVELLQITENVPPDSAFALSDGFVQVWSMDELHRRFESSGGGGDDWD
jgi:hypothetical protein